MNLTVDVISDVICPWRYIGKRRLEKAIAARDGQVKVRWLPFQLNPQMPKEGISRRDYRTKKFGTWELSLELDAQVAAAGAAEGIHFAFDRIERTPNTLDAHRLMFVAYFIESRDISKRQTLIDVVAEAGLDREKAEAALDNNDGYQDEGSFDITNYWLSTTTHEQCLAAAGLGEIRWHHPQVAAEGIASVGGDFWEPFLTHPPITFLECVR